MGDSRLRNLGTIVPGGRLAEPLGPDFPAPSLEARSQEDGRNMGLAAQAPVQTIFASDLPRGTDALGIDEPLARLASLAIHECTETPLTIGLFGAPGQGKSFALARLLQLITELSRAAPLAPSKDGDILTLSIDALDLSGNPAIALAAALHAGLAKIHPNLVTEASRAARDPQAAASEALERLELARRKLQNEKYSLDETKARRARLAEHVLHETAGSQIDAYACANRNRIKNLFTKLGLGGDSFEAYKDMAGSLAAPDGQARRAGFALRAFWAFKGQRKLLATGLFLGLANLLLHVALGQQAMWLAWLRTTDSLVPLANWLETHQDWLAVLSEILFVGAGAALGLALWRGLHLIRLVFRGAHLLQADLAVRQRELDELFAFQTGRVEALAAEVSALSRRAAEAEKRAGGGQTGRFLPAETVPFMIESATQNARAFVAAIGDLIAGSAQANSTTKGAAPRRIVLALDHLDGLPAGRWRNVLDHAQSLFRHGFVVIIAADPARLAAAGEAAPDLSKWIQVPFQLGELASRADYSVLVGQILGGEKTIAPRPLALAGLDQPLSAAETRLLANLAPLAGRSARALKRFVNLYRLTRTEKTAVQGALAFMLALDAGGTPAEIAAVEASLSHPAGPEWSLGLPEPNARLAEAFAAVQSLPGKASVKDAQRAAALSRLFSFRSHGSSSSA